LPSTFYPVPAKKREGRGRKGQSGKGPRREGKPDGGNETRNVSREVLNLREGGRSHTQEEGNSPQ